MRRYAFAMALVVLAACAKEHAMHPEPVEQTGFAIDDRSTEGEIAFAVMKNGRVFSDYGITHTKEMHLIVVRDDLRYFRHLHPARDEQDIWRIPFVPPAGGTYWMYADFADIRERSHTHRFDRTYSGDPGMKGIVHAPGLEKTIDDYRIQMTPTESADYVEFQYTVLDASGNAVVLEDYLGEKGHSIVLSDDGDFIHSHPHKEYIGYDSSDPPIFIVLRSQLRNEFQRIFTQFKINGRVITVDFDYP